MRAITVRQPWAWSIIHGGKDVENRSRNIAGGYRGPVAIHAGLGWSRDGEHDEQVARAYFDARRRQGWLVVDQEGALKRAATTGLGRFVLPEHFGAFIGVVDLVSVHHDSDHGRSESDACSPWRIADNWHLMLANPRPFVEPIPAKGRLGLWTPDADLLAQIGEATR